MKGRARELKASARRGSRADKTARAERDVLAEIAEMRDSDRAMAERVHAVATACAPDLAPKPWYGMPAHAPDGKVVCFSQSNEVERTISRLKNSRAVAPRYDRRSYVFHGTVTAAAIRLCLRP
ncbi:hypothetical protein GCM10010420_13250 [Streptomyces glaucosporus]|uniref:DUF1801 domain-containing protein n=1 Tax=Streptomyces glaucosporus TaxID=284044 RepID=A0ABP5V2V3_9ACTN